MSFPFSVQMPAFDNDDFAGNPSGTPAPTAPVSVDPTIQGNPPAPQPATPAAPVAAPTVQNQPEPSWLRGRLQETREAALRQANEQWTRERTQLQSQFEAVQRQLHALVGVGPQEDPEAAAIKQQFNKLFPGLAKLEQQAAQLEQVAQYMPQFQQQTDHYWTQYGQQNMNRLFDMASKSLGGPVTDEAKRSLHMAFSGYVASSPELTNRYASDPSIVDEFWNTFETSFIGPARRVATAQQAPPPNQRFIPQDSPSGVPVVQGPPQPRNLDDRVSQAWAAFSTGQGR